MKLWEAILAGCKLRPQTTEAYFSRGGSCALGAAGEGAGIFGYEEYSIALDEVSYSRILIGKWAVGADWVTCPVVDCSHPFFNRSKLFDVIAHVNDDHRWSRECIAHWVKPIEEKKEPNNGKEEAKKEEVLETCGARLQ